MSERNSKVNSIDVSDICTYETFQFCLFNAERLLDDSNKVSPPTQTASSVPFFAKFTPPTPPPSSLAAPPLSFP